MVQKSVEDSRGDGLVAEDMAPIGDLLVGGEQDAAACVPTWVFFDLKSEARDGSNS